MWGPLYRRKLPLSTGQNPSLVLQVHSKHMTLGRNFLPSLRQIDRASKCLPSIYFINIEKCYSHPSRSFSALNGGKCKNSGPFKLLINDGRVWNPKQALKNRRRKRNKKWPLLLSKKNLYTTFLLQKASVSGLSKLDSCLWSKPSVSVVSVSLFLVCKED